MPDTTRRTVGSNFRYFFARGLGIVLPTVLTIWLLWMIFTFVQDRIATPINRSIKELIIRGTDWPRVDDFDIARERRFLESEREFLDQSDRAARARLRGLGTDIEKQRFLRDWTRRAELEKWWSKYAWALDLMALLIAVITIYLLGAILGSYLGRSLQHRIERYIERTPMIGRVYPSVKQVTDFFVGENQPARPQFNRVVAVQYPRKGIWSVGLVTGTTMKAIQDRAATVCMTIFIPSSPTPFTGYVITVPVDEVIDLPVTLEEALKFAISGGVLVPPNQRIEVEGLETYTVEDIKGVPGSTTTNPAAPDTRSDPPRQS